MEGGGCFRTGLHYPGIAHLLRVQVAGLAEEWASDFPVLEGRWAVIDTETTGRDPLADRIVEIGVSFFEGGQPVGEFGSLIDPERPIPAEVTAVHGITDADVQGKPTFGALFEELRSALGGALPVAYNAEFDKGFLLAEVGRLQLEGEVTMPPSLRPSVTWIDPLTWAREIQKTEKSRALGDVCERLGIPLENAHRATHDAKAAGQVMSVFLRDSRVPSAYGAFIREQGRLEKMAAFERARWRS